MNASNGVFFEGHITATPKVEIKKQEGKKDFYVAETSIAVNKITKKSDGTKVEDVSFIPVIFRGEAVVTKLVEPYIKRGTHVNIVGEMYQQKWQNKESESRSRLVCLVSSCKLLDKKANNEDVPSLPSSSDETPPSIDINDDEIPF